VKYPKPVISNDVIQDFNQVRLAIKTDKQVFVFGIRIVPVKKTVVFNGIEGHFNVRFAHAMFEGGGIELYGKVHIFSIQRFSRGNKAPGGWSFLPQRQKSRKSIRSMKGKERRFPTKPPSGSMLRHRAFQAIEADRIPPRQGRMKIWYRDQGNRAHLSHPGREKEGGKKSAGRLKTPGTFFVLPAVRGYFFRL
jgi:hypothetical protein